MRLDKEEKKSEMIKEASIVNAGLNDLDNNKVTDGEKALKTLKDKHNL